MEAIATLEGMTEMGRVPQRYSEKVSLQDPQQRLRGFLLAGMYAPGTVKQYEGQVSQCKRFAWDCGEFPMWSEGSGAAWIINGMTVRQLAKSTLLRKIPAFQYGARKYANMTINILDKFSTFGMLRKMISRMPDTASRKIPIGRRHLPAVCQEVQKAVPGVMGLMLTAWFVVSYGALLRCSETKRIRWADVKFAREASQGVTPTYMEITTNNDVEVCKTNTCKISFRFKAAGHGELCAVRALWALLWQLAEVQQHPMGEVLNVTEEVARKALKTAAANAMQVHPSKVGLHSLRAGGATNTKELGLTLSQTMFMGRWRSPTVLAYRRESDLMLAQLGMKPSGSANEQSSTDINQCPNSHCHKRAFSPGKLQEVMTLTREDKPRGRRPWKVCSDSGFSSVLGKRRVARSTTNTAQPL
jgi:hypothetical protein